MLLLSCYCFSLLFYVRVEKMSSFVIMFGHIGQVRELMDEEMLQDVEIHFR
jgi:hypothetical protein